MNTKLIASTVVALAAMGSMSAFADTSDRMPQVAATPSTMTRAEVMADLQKASSEGTLQTTTESGNPVVAQKAAPSQLSREEVRKEALQAAKANQPLYGSGAE